MQSFTQEMPQSTQDVKKQASQVNLTIKNQCILKAIFKKKFKYLNKTYPILMNIHKMKGDGYQNLVFHFIKHEYLCLILVILTILVTFLF